MTTHEVLVAARNRLSDPENWCPEGTHGEGGQMCVAITIADISGTDEMDEYGPLYEPACGAVLDVLGRSRGRLGNGVVVGYWNDAPETTHADVLSVLDRAIAATAPQPVAA